MKLTDNDVKLVREAQVAIGEEKSKFGNICLHKTNLGRNLVTMFSNDELTFENGKSLFEQSEKCLFVMLNWLIHYQEYVATYKNCFLEWDDLALPRKGLSENMYLRTAERTKEDHAICESESFKNLFASILSILTHKTKESVYSLIETEHKYVEQEWFNAGFVKQLENKETGNIDINIDTPKHDKVGRNQLCPCLSGKKYKKCCA